VAQEDDTIIQDNLVFNQEQKLSSHPVKLNFILNDPMQLIMADSLLLISDFGATLVKVVNPVTGKELNSICRKGKGPGEFLDRIKITYNKRDNAINIFEVQVKILAQFPLSQALKWENDSVRKVLLDKPFIQQAIKCNDSLLVGVGMLEKRYALFNSAGKFKSVKYDYPDLSDKNWTFHLKSIEYQNDLVVNSIGSRIAEASLYCDNIGFFAVKGTDINKFKEYQSYSPDLENRSSGDMRVLHPKESTKFGYLDICAQGNHVYCLYSGKTIKESRRKGGPFHGSTIRVFDFDGNPVVSYKLDRDVFKFTVDTQEETIYAIVHTPEAEIVKFQL
jgi:hypothetical protein